MKLSKKSRYGLRALIDLAVYSENGHVALNSIAERNQISPQYLEQVFASLRKAGIVRSVKGAQGGYLLNDSPENITIASILEVLEGSYLLAPEEISEQDTHREIIAAVQRLVIDVVNQQVEEVLTNLTLADLEQDYRKNSNQELDMYYI